MLTLNVQVPETRDRTAIATLRDGLKAVATDHAAAAATPSIAAQRANPACDPLRLCGHPPFGRYRLLNHEPAQRDQLHEYGRHVLLFEPEMGQALEAESFGRLGLLVYGGAAGSDGLLRRTQGGLRLGNALLDAVASRLRPGEEMTLELAPLRPRSWWQFWKPRTATPPLSSSLPASLAPPADELSLLEALLQKSVRRPRPSTRERSEDSFDRSDRSDRSSSSTRSEREAFEGKGGTSGGAGAGGEWGDTGKGRGVDDAGRIMGAAAAVGAAGALAAMASQSEPREAGTSEAGSGSAVSHDGAPGASGDTTTTTAY